MRKILAGFLATSMIVAVASSVTFAAQSASFNVDLDNGFLISYPASGDSVTLEEVEVSIAVGGTSDVIDFAIPVDHTFKAGDTAVDLGKAIGGLSKKNIEIDGRLYDLAFSYAGKGSITATTDVKATFSPAAALPDATSVTLSLVFDNQGTGGTTTVPLGAGWAATSPRVIASKTYSGADINLGSGGTTADIETSGYTLNVKDVIVCDALGNPIPLTENPAGVDKDLNTDDGVQSGKTVYFKIKDGNYRFGDDSYWKLKINKGDNGKYVKTINDVTKNFSSDLYNAVNGAPVDNTGGKRYRYIKVELAEIFTDDEIKISLDMRLNSKDPAVSHYNEITDDTEFKIDDFSFYMKNIVKPADNDWKVGIGGLMLNPLQNDWNEVTYFDEDGDLAFMKFFADSDVQKFYAKLSTRWEHADYASYFNDQDAYIFDFVGTPKISATSRCDLQIYNPFVDEDGNETIDPSTAVIYQIIDGDLIEVTSSFEYKEGDNGDMAWVTRTRFLGTYIICERTVEEAVDDSANVPADLVPEDTTPSEVTPGNDNGGKAPANTGKYL